MARKIIFSLLSVLLLAWIFFTSSLASGRKPSPPSPPRANRTIPEDPWHKPEFSGQHLTGPVLHLQGKTPKAILPVRDTTGTGSGDTLIFPIQDRRGDFISNKERSTIDLADPPNIQKSVRFDPVTGLYDVRQRLDSINYRDPQFLTMGQYLQLQSRQDEDQYFEQRGSTMDLLNRKTSGPLMYRGPELYNRIFGGTQSVIQPQGNLDLTFGYQGQNYDNPTLPEAARRTGGFNFNMNINMNVIGKIGTKLKLITDYNTQSVFDFEKQIKLVYTGDPDEIIQKIEAGNVSFPLHSSLITGIQSLFGVKTVLQFGRLTMTSVVSNQKSQQQNMTIQGGAQQQQFSIPVDQYEDNRHFLLAQYFHDNFDNAVSKLPIIQSKVYIKRIEVWVTNQTGATVNVRNVVGLMDLGESNPYNPIIHSRTSSPLPQNGANDEYSNIISNSASRNSATVISELTSMGLQPVQDFEKTFARKLDSTEYTFDPQLGYISLNQQLQPDQVLAVAYQYTFNGRVYQVGEFSTDVPPDSSGSNPQILFLKLLKATAARPKLPIWKLMMKNIYSLGGYQVSRDGFQLNIFYQDPAGAQLRYLPVGASEGIPLLTLLNLDRLNSNNDPQPDGQFDYIEGYTIKSPTGRIMFPELEPFGADLAKAFQGDSATASKYVYQVLYDSTKTIAQQFPQLDRYLIQGTYKSNSGSSIFLGGYNIPPGSVTVTAGGQRLTENIDYTIDYSLGRLTIINAGILNSGLPISVQFENNASYGLQTRNYFGNRLEYSVNKHLTLGSTVVRMSEKPYFTTVNYGQDPIKNTILGFDADYRSELPGVTNWLNRLPNYTTNTMSSIMATAEVARLYPGHSNLIGNGNNGAVYIDDFEGTQNDYDLMFPTTIWALASTPAGATDRQGNVLFPEATLTDSLPYGYNRAKLAWYTIDQSLVDGGPGTPAYLTANKNLLSDPYTRSILQTEVFPNISVDFGQSYLSTFDLAFYPTEKGPYNLEYRPGEMDASGHLLNPQQRWGGIMRALDVTDFEAANVAYIEFWILDPYINNPTDPGGEMYIDLGDVSEDILRDGLQSFENGLPYPPNAAALDSSVWGYVPKFQQEITYAFDNDPAARPYQDVGYDGMSDVQERVYRAQYLQQLMANFGAGSVAYQQALNDPDNDDYHYYRGADYDAEKLSVRERYKNFNNPEGDSPISGPSSQYSTAATNSPETEDINHDNTLNENEAYFQYQVDIKPNMQVGTNFIVDEQHSRVVLANGQPLDETWYQFKIPIQSYTANVGGIPDFRSIRFIRMFLTGFTDSVDIRFAKLDLVRDQWRSYNYSLETPGQYVPIDPNSPTHVDVSAVNIEENATRYPVPYLSPPGILRQTQTSANNVNLQLNEQSLSLKVTDLQDGDSRAVFKSLGMDLRQYGQLQMFIHAEAVTDPSSLKDGDVQAFIRLGSDFVNNYYEYRIPLHVTAFGATLADSIWPALNNLDINLALLPKLKVDRNIQGIPITVPYSEKDQYGNTITVVGNPNLGDVSTAMLGILNPKKDSITNPNDDGLPKSTEVWFDELRLTGINEQGGSAAVGSVNMQLADLGTLSASAAMHTQGFGSVDQSVNQRFLDNYLQYNAAASLQLGKLLPRSLGLSLPLYAGYTQNASTPQYDPYNQDVELNAELALAKTRAQRDSIRAQAVTFQSIKSLNFTNVRIMRPGRTTHHLWDISNFNLSYAFSQTLVHNPLLQNDLLTHHELVIGYNFIGQSKFITPFSKLIRSKSHYFDLIRDFNINFIPSSISIRGDFSRLFEATTVRNVGGGPFTIPPTFNKYFTVGRFYALKWDFTRSLIFDFNANANATVDEPFGYINTPSKKDTVINNLLHLGRTTLYNQTADLNYNLPLNHFPLLDWITARAGYSVTYSWQTASQLAMYLGNTLQNTYQDQINAEFNFIGLYNKSGFLRRITGAGGPNSRGRPGQKKDQKSSLPVSPLLKAIIRPVLMLKQVTVNYSENGQTIIPGYMDSTKFLGEDWKMMSPGLRFISGYQPDSLWLNNLARRGLLSADSTFNSQLLQTFNQQLSIQAALEPFPNMRIDISLNKSFSKTHTELFLDTASGTPFAHLNPSDAGGFNISFIALKTLFEKTDAQTGLSQTFLNFENDRQAISARLGYLNPYTNGQRDSKDPNYYQGYGRFAQDVLIPAFVAAYTGTSPGQVGLLKTANSNPRSDPFSNYIPRPNWRFTYTGLSQLPFFKNFVTNLTITDAYSGTLSMNSFSSNLLYTDPLHTGFPSFIDTLSGDYIPYFLIPNITVSEQLEPLLGIDATFKNNINFKLEYNLSRTLSLSLIDYQLTELRSSEITVGGGFRVKNVGLPFNLGSGKKQHNDLNCRLDLSFANNKTVNNQLDANLVIPTSGEEVILISPSIDYVVNNKLNLHFFYTRQQTIPAISTSYPISNTQGGVTLRFLLGQ